MLQLADWLREWAVSKVTSDPRFRHTSFIISDASEPGEGEHKVRGGWRQGCLGQLQTCMCPTLSCQLQRRCSVAARMVAACR